jgi:hypothetical protein
MFEQGRPLTVQERTLFSPYFANIVLEQARVIDGKVPFWLSKRMCAVVVYNHIYFRSGVYQPNTRLGAELLGHELTHVSQFLHGMTLLNYIWSCRKGYLQSTYEIEAYAKGKFIAKYFNEFAL